MLTNYETMDSIRVGVDIVEFEDENDRVHRGVVVALKNNSSTEIEVRVNDRASYYVHWLMARKVGEVTAAGLSSS